MAQKVKLSNHYGSFNKTGDVYEVRFERLLPHPASQVWEAITEPEKLAMWLGKARVDLRAEGEIHIRFQDMDITGQILQYKAGELLEYTWTSQSFPGEISIVRFELISEGENKCKLIFSERLVSAPYLTGAASGWHFILDTLSMVLDGLPLPAWSDEMRMDIFEQLGPKYKEEQEKKTNAKVQPVVETALLIRKRVEEVFEAMVDPAITTRFWYTKGSDRLDSGRNVKWEWEMYNVSTEVCAHEIKKNKHIAFNWSSTGGVVTTVEWTFTPYGDSSTFFSITERGMDADDERIHEFLVGQTGGWTLVLAGLKAFLEFNIELPLVADRHPRMAAAHAE